MQSIKCVTVGDGGVGKSCMLISYVNGYTPGEYIPTIFDNFSSIVNIDGRPIRLELWDTAGQEDYRRLRSLSYNNTDVFLVCFAITSPSSFKNVELEWMVEIKHLCKHAKIILVGTKFDLRSNPETIEQFKIRGEKPISHSQGVMLAKKIGAVKYMECSAHTTIGVAEIFDAAAQAVIQTNKPVIKKRKFCSIL